MTEKAGRPTPEVYMLQKELEKVRAQLRQEQAIGDHEKHHVGNRLQEEVCQSFCEPFVIMIPKSKKWKAFLSFLQLNE